MPRLNKGLRGSSPTVCEAVQVMVDLKLNTMPKGLGKTEKKTMLRDGNIWVTTKASVEAICLIPQKVHWHGLIASADNAEVDCTAHVLAEGFSSLGIPVLITDVNRSLASVSSLYIGRMKDKAGIKERNKHNTESGKEGCRIIVNDKINFT